MYARKRLQKRCIELLLARFMGSRGSGFRSLRVHVRGAAAQVEGSGAPRLGERRGIKGKPGAVCAGDGHTEAVKVVETPSGETSFSKLGKKELPDISRVKSKLTGGLSKLPMKSMVPPFPSTEVGDSEFKASSTSDDESEQASTSSSIVSPAPFEKGLPIMKKSSQ